MRGEDHGRSWFAGSPDSQVSGLVIRLVAVFPGHILFYLLFDLAPVMSLAVVQLMRHLSLAIDDRTFTCRTTSQRSSFNF